MAGGKPEASAIAGRVLAGGRGASPARGPAPDGQTPTGGLARTEKRLEQATPSFTEVTVQTATRPSPANCVLERETSQGKIRLELSGLGVSEIAALVRELGG